MSEIISKNIEMTVTKLTDKCATSVVDVMEDLSNNIVEDIIGNFLDQYKWLIIIIVIFIILYLLSRERH